MPPRRCCCDSCIIAFDDFKRADALTLGDAWTDPLAVWNIFGETALCNTGSEAIAIFNLEHPTPSTSMVVAIETLDEEEDQEFWVLLNVLDANNYHVAKLKIGPPMEIELGRVNAGVYTSLVITAVSGETGTSRRFGAAISPTEFCASVTNAVLSLTFQDGPPSLISLGYKSGMGGEDEARIDYFEFSHHRHTKAECLYCLCECDDDFYLAPTLTATLSGTGRMSGLSCEFDIKWDRVLQNWTGSATCCNPFTIDLYCPISGALEDIRIEVQGCIDSDVAGTVGVEGYIAAGERYTRIPESECKPLYLLFGPFFVSSGDLACACGDPFVEDGEFFIEITSG